MSVTVGALRVEISANSAALEESMARVSSQIRSLAKEWDRTARSLDRIGTSLQRVGPTLAAAVTAPLAAAAVGSVRFAADFDAAMNESVAIMGDLNASMRQTMDRTAREVAKTTVFSATQAAESFYFLASAGLDA